MRSTEETGRHAAADSLKNRSLIGIDLGATNVRVARILGGRVDVVEAEEIVKSDDPADLLNQIERLIEKLNDDDVESIGIGVPSVVDVEKGVVYDVQNIPAWKEVKVKSIFEKRFGKPVYVNNDANCFVLGEKYFGKARGHRSIVGLTLGSGFGSGLILNGKLYSGEHCGAGEVGMLPYRNSIFEHYCSGMYFEREFGLSGREVFEKAENGDAKALIIYESFGVNVGNAVKAVLYAYDPQMIVLGGSIRKAWSYFSDTMYKAMEDFAYPNSLSDLEIVVSELDEVAVLGAAALSLD